MKNDSREPAVNGGPKGVKGHEWPCKIKLVTELGTHMHPTLEWNPTPIKFGSLASRDSAECQDQAKLHAS